MNRYTNIVIATLLLVLTPKLVFAGAWTVPKHKIWSEVFMKANWAKETFTGNGDRGRLVRDARSWSWEIEPKFEFGITDWLNALGSVSFFESHYKEYARPIPWGTFKVKNNGAKFVTAGGKARLIQNPFVGSIQVKSSLWTEYEISKAPAAGKGDDSLEIRGIVSKSFDLPLGIAETSLPCYVSLESGYRFRNRDVANDVVMFAEGGIIPFNWLQVKSEIDISRSHPNTGSQIEEYGIWRIGGTWRIFGDSTQRKGLIFNVEGQYGMVVFGKNTTASQELVLKIQTQF